MRRLALLLLLLTASGALAHPLSPALLELRETSTPGAFDVLWKTSVLRVPGSDLRPLLPEHCEQVGELAIEEAADSLVRRWSVRCGERGLIGSRVGFDGLGPAKIDALVHISLNDGRVVRAVVRADQPTLTVPAATPAGGVFGDYLNLGFDHILGGLDHLLFVFGLLLLVDGTRQLVKTITAFTVGHSITLTLAALGLVRYPTRPIELVIALSVFLVAVELTRTEQGRPTLMRRRPWAVAMGFGLLHGLGFAGALAEVGLPPEEIPVALLSFNVGIELGQLAFVFAILMGHRLFRPVIDKLPHWAELVPLYAMGSLAAFWCFERLAAVLA